MALCLPLPDPLGCGRRAATSCCGRGQPQLCPPAQGCWRVSPAAAGQLAAGLRQEPGALCGAEPPFPGRCRAASGWQLPAGASLEHGQRPARASLLLRALPACSGLGLCVHACEHPSQPTEPTGEWALAAGRRWALPWRFLHAGACVPVRGTSVVTPGTAGTVRCWRWARASLHRHSRRWGDRRRRGQRCGLVPWLLLTNPAADIAAEPSRAPLFVSAAVPQSKVRVFGLVSSTACDCGDVVSGSVAGNSLEPAGPCGGSSRLGRGRPRSGGTGACPEPAASTQRGKGGEGQRDSGERGLRPELATGLGSANAAQQRVCRLAPHWHGRGGRAGCWVPGKHVVIDLVPLMSSACRACPLLGFPCCF